MSTRTVFEVTGKDGEKDFKDYLSVKFDAQSGSVKTDELVVPLDTELTVTEVYSGNYKPAAPKTVKPADLITTDAEGKILDEPYYEVEFENKLVRHNSTKGIINKYSKYAGDNFRIVERVGAED